MVRKKTRKVKWKPPKVNKAKEKKDERAKTDKKKEVEGKLLEINRFISTLKPEIRLEAFKILSPHYFSERASEEMETKPLARQMRMKKGKIANPDDFFGAFAQERPSDNVMVIAAYLFYQHGPFPLTGKIIKDIADKRNLLVPTRPDNTIRYARRRGKRLFFGLRGGWQLSVHGQKYIKETYDLKKMRAPLY